MQALEIDTPHGLARVHVSTAQRMHSNFGGGPFSNDAMAAVADHFFELLLDALDSCGERGGTMRLAAPNSLCRDIFKVTGVSEQFEIFDNTVTAIGSFARTPHP